MLLASVSIDFALCVVSFISLFMDNKKASVALLHTALVETIPQGLVPVRMFLLVGLPSLVLSPVELSVLVFVHVVKEPLPRGSRRIPFGPGCHSIAILIGAGEEFLHHIVRRERSGFAALHFISQGPVGISEPGLY